MQRENTANGVVGAWAVGGWGRSVWVLAAKRGERQHLLRSDKQVLEGEEELMGWGVIPWPEPA